MVKIDLSKEILPKEHICELVEKYIEFYKLTNYMNDYRVINANINNDATGVFNGRDLKIYRGNIIEFYKDTNPFFINYQILLTTYHELTHVEQIKLIKETNGIESDILYHALNVHTENPPLYEQYYDIFPTEYNAELKGIINSYQVFHNTYGENAAIDKVFTDQYLNLVNPYITNQDLSFFYGLTYDFDKYQKIINTPEIDTQTKILLGIPNDEIPAINKMLTKKRW